MRLRRFSLPPPVLLHPRSAGGGGPPRDRTNTIRDEFSLASFPWPEAAPPGSGHAGEPHRHKAPDITTGFSWLPFLHAWCAVPCVPATTPFPALQSRDPFVIGSPKRSSHPQAQRPVALRRGDRAAAARDWTAALKGTQQAGTATTLDGKAKARLRGEVAVMRLSQGEYSDLLRLLFSVASIYWGDVIYIAERVLTVDELKAFVDGLPAPRPATPTAIDYYIWSSDFSFRPTGCGSYWPGGWSVTGESLKRSPIFRRLRQRRQRLRATAARSRRRVRAQGHCPMPAPRKPATTLRRSRRPGLAGQPVPRAGGSSRRGLPVPKPCSRSQHSPASGEWS